VELFVSLLNMKTNTKKSDSIEFTLDNKLLNGFSCNRFTKNQTVKRLLEGRGAVGTETILRFLNK